MSAAELWQENYGKLSSFQEQSSTHSAHLPWRITQIARICPPRSGSDGGQLTAVQVDIICWVTSPKYWFHIHYIIWATKTYSINEQDIHTVYIYILLYYYIILYYIILYYTMLYYIILCYIILYYNILYYIILYYTILYYIILYYTILYYIILYYTILYYIILYYTILYYIILYYSILYYIILYYTILYYIILYYTIYIYILYYIILYYIYNICTRGRFHRSPAQVCRVTAASTSPHAARLRSSQIATAAATLRRGAAQSMQGARAQEVATGWG